MSEANFFEGRDVQSWGPAYGAAVIAPSDSTDLPKFIRQITIGGTGGTISFISSVDGQTYTTGFLPVGTYPLYARRIRSSGTSAAVLTGWF